MRFADLDRAASRARDLRDLERDRDTGRFGVTVNGRYQDDTMLEVVQGAIKAELQRRIDALAAELADMGVELP